MKKTMDRSTTAAYISYAFTRATATYPTTPNSTIAELVDEWAESGLKNIYGQKVQTIEMQSEAGAARVVRGSLKIDALTTTYIASQGSLLMVPSMYEIAGELLPSVFHMAARTVTVSASDIFGDHGGVMATRQTGSYMLVELSVQEVVGLSAITHLASLEDNLPFVNFFDGFRTNHGLQKIGVIDYDDLKEMVNQEAVIRFKMRDMNPNHPTVLRTA